MGLNLVRATLALGLALLLAACGGGGSSSSSAPQGERINGRTVPPMPDATANTASVAGVDVDGSGIRDDIDRMIASEFGADSTLYAKAVVFAKTEQAALLNPDPAVVEAHLASVGCVGDRAALARLSNMTEAVVNTPARGRAYVKAFAGATLSKRSCR